MSIHIHAIRLHVGNTKTLPYEQTLQNQIFRNQGLVFQDIILSFHFQVLEGTNESIKFTHTNNLHFRAVDH